MGKSAVRVNRGQATTSTAAEKSAPKYLTELRASCDKYVKNARAIANSIAEQEKLLADIRDEMEKHGVTEVDAPLALAHWLVPQGRALNSIPVKDFLAACKKHKVDNDLVYGAMTVGMDAAKALLPTVVVDAIKHTTPAKSKDPVFVIEDKAAQKKGKKR